MKTYLAANVNISEAEKSNFKFKNRKLNIKDRAGHQKSQFYCVS